MFLRRPPLHENKATLSRSMSPGSFRAQQERVSTVRRGQTSKRSLSVLNERSKERD